MGIKWPSSGACSHSSSQLRGNWIARAGWDRVKAESPQGSCFLIKGQVLVLPSGQGVMDWHWAADWGLRCHGLQDTHYTRLIFCLQDLYWIYYTCSRVSTKLPLFLWLINKFNRCKNLFQSKLKKIFLMNLTTNSASLQWGSGNHLLCSLCLRKTWLLLTSSFSSGLTLCMKHSFMPLQLKARLKLISLVQFSNCLETRGNFRCILYKYLRHKSLCTFSIR